MRRSCTDSLTHRRTDLKLAGSPKTVCKKLGVAYQFCSLPWFGGSKASKRTAAKQHSMWAHPPRCSYNSCQLTWQKWATSHVARCHSRGPGFSLVGRMARDATSPPPSVRAATLHCTARDGTSGRRNLDGRELKKWQQAAGPRIHLICSLCLSLNLRATNMLLTSRILPNFVGRYHAIHGSRVKTNGRENTVNYF